MIEIEVFGKKDTRSGFGEGLLELGQQNYYCLWFN